MDRFEKETSIAHVKQINGSWEIHELADHLDKVGQMAGDFASCFDSRQWGLFAGRWHDLGKFSRDFQAHIREASGFDKAEAHVERKDGGRVDHSTAGAVHAVEQWGVHGRVLAYLIAGHHAGLPDWEKLEEGTGGALRERLQQGERLERALTTESVPETLLVAERPEFQVPGNAKGFALWVRMLFSCLVDADFLDTEAFMDEGKTGLRGDYPSLAELRGVFDRHMRRLVADAPDTAVNRVRRRVLAECRRAAAQPSGLFSLTVPTGGGKTLSSMAFALDHAIARDKRRVIHVIPYTSIIEQTADIFRHIFGEAVIEHHSALDPDRETARSRLAAENWDAPIVVTTSVQFFESLFAARTSRCRKLHNIVNSVVVLDEVQLLPPGFLQPILDVLNLLATHYGVTVVLSTATQPALETRKDPFGKTRLRGLEGVREIMTDPDALHEQLERVDVTLPADLNTPQSWESLAEEVTRHPSVLVIVNTRRQARELHRLLPKGTIHLSALMCGQHRSEVIAGIKERLRRGEPVRVVSTQLVEAGVDLDFPVVYRALSGLDSIAQAAGRCNREGRLERGEVVLFVPPDPIPPGLMRRAASKTVSVLASNGQDPLSQENFRQFFRLFYDECELDKAEIASLLETGVGGNDPLRVQFRTAAKRFRLIEEESRVVLVRHVAEEGKENIDGLLNRLRSEGPDRWLMRKLQRYTVNVSERHFQQLQRESLIEEIWPGIWAQMEGTPLYDPVLGLALDAEAPQAIDLVV